MACPAGFKKYFKTLSDKRKSVKILISEELKEIIINALKNKRNKNNKVLKIFKELINSNYYIKKSFINDNHYNFFDINIDENFVVYSRCINVSRFNSFFNLDYSSRRFKDYFTRFISDKTERYRNNVRILRRFTPSINIDRPILYTLNNKDINREEIFKMFNSLIKIGSAIKSTFNNINDSDIEYFVGIIKQSKKDIDNKKFSKICEVTGDDILYYYNSSKYNKKESGTLGSSCMRYLERNEFMKLYSENSNCSLIIYKESEKVISARALLWTDNLGNKIVDRIYCSSDKYGRILYEYCANNKYKFIHESALHYNRSEKLFRESSHYINLDVSEFDKYPYADTFCYIDIKNKKLFRKIDHCETEYRSYLKTIRSQYGNIENGNCDENRLETNLPQHFNANKYLLSYDNKIFSSIDEYVDFNDNTLINIDLYKDVLNNNIDLNENNIGVNDSGEYVKNVKNSKLNECITIFEDYYFFYNKKDDDIKINRYIINSRALKPYYEDNKFALLATKIQKECDFYEGFTICTLNNIIIKANKRYGSFNEKISIEKELIGIVFSDIFNDKKVLITNEY